MMAGNTARTERSWSSTARICDLVKAGKPDVDIIFGARTSLLALDALMPPGDLGAQPPELLSIALARARRMGRMQRGRHTCAGASQ